MSEHTSQNGRVGIIVGVVVLVIASSLGAWYFFKYKPDQEAKEKARLEQIAKAEAEEKRKQQAVKRKTKYDQLIKSGDEQFYLEQWEAARSQYAEASAIIKNQDYPKNQIALIDVRLNEIAAIEARKVAGVVETISSPTGRFYIIVSSSIDDDLALDYAKKLVAQGEEVKIVEHEASSHFYYRVALGDYATQELADAASLSFGDYGSDIWVLKY